ncbi:NSP3 [Rotavirus K]|nr:NSP3 [Rotavirus K]
MATQAATEWIFNTAGSAAAAAIAKAIEHAGGSKEFGEYVIARFFDNYKDAVDDSGVYNASMGRARSIDMALEQKYKKVKRNEEWHTNLETVKRLDLEVAEHKILLSTLGMKREDRVLNSLFEVEREEGKSSTRVTLKDNAYQLMEAGRLTIEVKRDLQLQASLNTKITELETELENVKLGNDVEIGLDLVVPKLKLDGESCAYNSAATFISTILGSPVQMWHANDEPVYDVGPYINPKQVVEKMIEGKVPIYKSDFKYWTDDDFTTEGSNLIVYAYNNSHAIVGFKIDGEWKCCDEGRIVSLEPYLEACVPLLAADRKYTIDRIRLSGDVELNPGPDYVSVLNLTAQRLKVKVDYEYTVMLTSWGEIEHMCICYCMGQEMASSAKTKKQAKQNAAHLMLQELNMK